MDENKDDLLDYQNDLGKNSELAEDENIKKENLGSILKTNINTNSEQEFKEEDVCDFDGFDDSTSVIYQIPNKPQLSISLVRNSDNINSGENNNEETKNKILEKRENKENGKDLLVDSHLVQQMNITKNSLNAEESDIDKFLEAKQPKFTMNNLTSNLKMINENQENNDQTEFNLDCEKSNIENDDHVGSNLVECEKSDIGNENQVGAKLADCKKSDIENDNQVKSNLVDCEKSDIIGSKENILNMSNNKKESCSVNALSNNLINTENESDINIQDSECIDNLSNNKENKINSLDKNSCISKEKILNQNFKSDDILKDISTCDTEEMSLHKHSSKNEDANDEKEEIINNAERNCKINEIIQENSNSNNSHKTDQNLQKSDCETGMSDTIELSKDIEMQNVKHAHLENDKEDSIEQNEMCKKLPIPENLILDDVNMYDICVSEFNNSALKDEISAEIALLEEEAETEFKLSEEITNIKSNSLNEWEGEGIYSDIKENWDDISQFLINYEDIAKKCDDWEKHSNPNAEEDRESLYSISDNDSGDKFPKDSKENKILSLDNEDSASIKETEKQDSLGSDIPKETTKSDESSQEKEVQSQGTSTKGDSNKDVDLSGFEVIDVEFNVDKDEIFENEDILKENEEVKVEKLEISQKPEVSFFFF